MTSQRESDDVTGAKPEDPPKDLSELPPIGLHKRRRGEPPASLSVKSPQAASETEGSSPCTAGPYEYKIFPEDDPKALCDSILQRLKDRSDLPSERGRELAAKTKDTFEAMDLLETLLKRLDQFTTLKEYNAHLLKRLRDVNQLKRLHLARKRVNEENQRLRNEGRDLELINESLDTEFEREYGQVIYENMLSSGRSMKRTGSKWKGHARFGGTLLRKQRSRSAGGEDSDAAPGTPLRRRSEGLFSKEVEKSKVSKWTRVKAAFRWEKAQWPTSAMAGAAGAVVAGATMVGAVALAGTSPPGSTPSSAALCTGTSPPAPSTSLSASGTSPSTSGTSPSSSTLPHPEPRDSASLTPGSAASLSPNSSCEELRMDHMCRKEASILRYDENDNTFLHAPPQDDSSTSPSPNKLHKSRWGKMRDMLQPHKESVKKRGSKNSPDVVPTRRRSLSDGGDSDAPPALTLTIPSSEELESDPHPVLRKQRSLELGARPPQHRPPRASKWTKVKRAFLTSASASVPSSPSRHSAFFTDAETEGLSSGCEATGMREEIARDYAALQSRLRREFSDRRGKYNSTRPVATEEQLSADFRKKLAEWQLRKSAHQRQPPPVPARQDLSEDFLKKWDKWNSMKETNSVPAWEEEAKPDEVLVQTSTGLFKFQGISRSFTRKLHEWEKSRGIAPEASTSALLRAARARNKAPPAPLTRTQSDGSVAPSAAGSGRLHASSLSVNDADDFDSDYEREHSLDGADECDDGHVRGAVLVEVEAEEVCTAAPLMAVSPRHTPQKPIYTYGQAEARLLCETSSAVTGTAMLQPNGAESRGAKCKGITGSKSKSSREQAKESDKSVRKKIVRQPSIEEDAMFIRKTIEEVERGSSLRFKNEENITDSEKYERIPTIADIDKPSTSKGNMGSKGSLKGSKHSILKERDSFEDLKEDKRKESDKGNGKKKSKSRARLEREQSKPSESDTEPDIDTVTVEIPRRRKRPRRASERPRTPPTARFHTDSEEEVFVLKLKAPERREHSPEVIVKTTRKIFSPVVRSGESVPRAVIPLDVEELADVRPSMDHSHRHSENKHKKYSIEKEPNKKEKETRSKSSGDLRDEEQVPRTRPPLPSSPSSQRKPQSKETAPSIRIMIQRYNKKINEEGNTSGPSSGASSPAWRSPAAERRRPPDMPVGVNIRNNPFLEREVQKSASACQLSRRDQTSVEKRLTPTPSQVLDGVLKSHSANALHPEQNKTKSPKLHQRKIEVSQETIKYTASTDTIVPGTDTIVPGTDTIVPDLTRNLPESQSQQTNDQVYRQMSEVSVPSLSSFVAENPGFFERSLSTVDAPSTMDTNIVTRLSDRAAKIRAARERFLSSPVPIRREGTSSASDLRPGDRSSRISCESDVTESQSSQEPQLGRSASTGMVNVDSDAWQRVAEGGRRESRSRSRFSLARLAAKLPGKLRKKDEGAVSRLCRQSLLVQLRNKQ